MSQLDWPCSDTTAGRSVADAGDTSDRRRCSTGFWDANVMPIYSKAEARDWAWATMRGCANVLIPSYTADLQSLNEAAIRQDVQLEIQLGFWGTLLVAETATTLHEYTQFVEWAADESRGQLHLIHHASFNTLEENI